MRLYLAIAVLMLALVAYTEAQEETIEQRFAKFTEQMSQLGQNLREKLKSSFDDFQIGDLADRSKARVSELFEWMKTAGQ